MHITSSKRKASWHSPERRQCVCTQGKKNALTQYSAALVQIQTNGKTCLQKLRIIVHEIIQQTWQQLSKVPRISFTSVTVQCLKTCSIVLERYRVVIVTRNWWAYTTCSWSEFCMYHGFYLTLTSQRKQCLSLVAPTGQAVNMKLGVILTT